MALRKGEQDSAAGAAAAGAVPSEAPAYWVCLGLLVALISLAARIASIW